MPKDQIETGSNLPSYANYGEFGDIKMFPMDMAMNRNFNIIGWSGINIAYNRTETLSVRMIGNPTMQNAKSPYPAKIGEFSNYQPRSNNFIDEKNKFTEKMNNGPPFQTNNYINNFIYNGDSYQISQFKQYKKNNYSKNGEIPTIGAADLVTTITANNKSIK